MARSPNSGIISRVEERGSTVGPQCKQSPECIYTRVSLALSLSVTHTHIHTLSARVHVSSLSSSLSSSRPYSSRCAFRNITREACTASCMHDAAVTSIAYIQSSPSNSLSVYICLSIYLSIYLSSYLPICLFSFLSLSLSLLRASVRSYDLVTGR